MASFHTPDMSGADYWSWATDGGLAHDDKKTLFMWVYPQDNSNKQVPFALGESTLTPHSHDLVLRGDDASDYVGCSIRESNTEMPLTGSYSLNTWQSVIGTFVYPADDRNIGFNGGSFTTSTRDTADGAPYNEVRAGVGVYTTNFPFTGYLAELAIWSGDLTEAEFAILHKGFSPLFVRREDLRFYAPLVNDERDWISGKAASKGNKPGWSAEHPRIIRPGRLRTYSIPLPPDDGNAVVMLHQSAMRRVC